MTFSQKKSLINYCNKSHLKYICSQSLSITTKIKRTTSIKVFVVLFYNKNKKLNVIKYNL